MLQAQTEIGVQTRGARLYEVTRPVTRFVSESGIATGLLTIFCRHTSCSLLIQENADPSVCEDLEAFFARLVPEGMNWLTHTTEGPDDMPAHIKAALTQTVLNVPVSGGAMVLGTWQGLYLFEHRRSPHGRKLVLHIMGEAGNG